MVSTLQEMYFRTESDMQAAIDWLVNNQTSPDEYDIRNQGEYPDGDWFYMTIWFDNMNPLALAYYAATEHLMFDPWAPPEDPEDPEGDPEE